MRKLLLSLMASAITLTAAAQGKLYLGYCDGQIADGSNGNVTGLTGNSASITEAICLTPDMLAPYVGEPITAINAGLAQSASLPAEITVWISNTKGGSPLLSATLPSPTSGWNEVHFSTPYTITGTETELWIGFDFVQAKKLSVISFAGETNANGCWVAKNGKYTDYSGKNWGSLAVEALLESESLPTRDLTIVSAKANNSLTQAGNPIKTTVTIRNNAATDADQPIIDYSLNGELVGSYTYPGTLLYRQSATLSIEVPTTESTPLGDAVVSYQLRWSDGSADQNEADNVASLTTSLSDIVNYRTMVVEEGTGSWCGWCVRGIVGLKYMRENHFDNFIGIGVHNSDTYTVSAYDTWMCNQISGFPSCLINRDGSVYDPNSSDLEAYYQSMNQVTSYGLSLNVTVDEQGVLTYHTDFTSLANDANADFNLVYVLLEDQLPISQHNYYSGGGYGEMGGFESMGSTCDILLDDIARAVYPAPAGVGGIIPSSIVARETYSHDYQCQLPTVANMDNVWAAVLLVNNATGEIVQGAKCMTIGAAEGIQQLRQDNVAQGVILYDLQGRAAQPEQKGLLVRDGKVILQK